jgi:hypothetical protein
MWHPMKRALASLFLIAFGSWLVYEGFEGALINGLMPAHWIGFPAILAGVVSIFLVWGEDPPVPPEQKERPSEGDP